MKETVPGDPAPKLISLPLEAQSAFEGFAARLRARADMVWGEHCSECAYPGCYATCAFYEPRAGDLNCRRFEAGIEPLKTPGGARLTRIRFRRWGKLESKGSARVRSHGGASLRAILDEIVDRSLRALPLPFAAGASLAWRWNARKGRPAGSHAPQAEMFVVEALSLTGAAHAFTLSFLEQGGAARLHQLRFEVGPTYVRLETPLTEIARAIDLDQPFLVQIEPVGEAAGVDAVFGVVDFVQARPEVKAEVKAEARAVAAGAQTPLAKVVVWDLDETVWRGVLAEDGQAGVSLRPEAAAAIRDLDQRGVLQSIASKNDHAEALAALSSFGLADYFLHPQIGWGPKSQSVSAIAAALDLGLDSLVFIDDQPFERGEVAAACPGVRVLPETAVARLADHPWFAHPVTAESRSRRASYRAEAARCSAYASTGGDYLRFLKGCAITLELAPLQSSDVVRVHELSQRTNQLNFRGTKYALADVEAMLAPARQRARLTARCADRFGDYGLIGFVDLDLESGEVADFFMSCRVQRKRVENALFAHLAGRLAERGHTSMTAVFRPTERNGASERLLTELGFQCVESGLWRRSLATPFAESEVARLVTPAARAA